MTTELKKEMTRIALSQKLRNNQRELVMNKKRKVGTIDLTPSWVAATRIYCAVLQNPDAGHEAKFAAEQDLLSLATAMDRIKEQSKAQRPVEFVTKVSEMETVVIENLENFDNLKNILWRITFAGGEYEIVHCPNRGRLQASWAVVRLNDMAESERYYSWPNGAFTALSSGAIKWRK